MSPRTNWDTRDTPGVEAYRRRRRAKGVDTADRPEDLGKEGIRETSSSIPIDTAHSPADQVRMQETHFADNLKRDSALRRRKHKIKSGETFFPTGADAARALANRKKRN